MKCRKCGRPTWTGCGTHIEFVLRDVPKEERCVCPREEEDEEDD